MTKLNSNRISTDIALVEDMSDELIDSLPEKVLRDALKKVFKPFLSLAASLGVSDTATLSEVVMGHRLEGEVNPSIGFDLLVPSPNGGPDRYVEVKTRTAIKNSSGNCTRDEQKVVVKLSKSQETISTHLCLEVVAKNHFSGESVITYYIIPRQARVKAFDIRLNKDGLPSGNCKWSRYAFSDKKEMKERLDSLPSYTLEDAIPMEPSTPVSTITHTPVTPTKIVDIFEP